MEKNLSNNPINTLFIIALGLLFALPVFPSNLKAVVILFFAVATLVASVKQGWTFHKSFFLTNSLPYLVMIPTLLYVDNMDYGFAKLQTMASLVVFPLLFAMFKPTTFAFVKPHLKKFLLVYILAVFLLNVVPFFYFYLSNPNYDLQGILKHFPTAMVVDTGKYEIHPIYLSMHCSIASMFILYVFAKFKQKGIKILLGLIAVVLVLFLILYAKKGPLLALMAVSFLYIVFQRKHKLFRPYVIGLILLIGLLAVIPKTRNNFIELLTIETIEEGAVTSTNVRYTIYETAAEKIKVAFFTGYGIGDHNDALYEGYKDRGNDYLYNKELNAHNQYFSLLLIGGIVLLLAFLYFLGINMVYAIRFNNQLLILVLIFYGIVMFTENILEREDGVIYFALFLNFFSWFSRENESAQ